MTSEFVKEMLNKAKDRLKEAQLLLDERFYGGSISTSYYAILDAARILLEQEGTSTKTHSGAIVKFNDLFIKTGKIPRKFGKIFSNIEESRREADYNFQAIFTQDDAMNALLEAREFVNEIEIFLGK